jgi:tRNA(fMet)-specific endonuclease VapC
MILLDTDHITILGYPENAAHGRLIARMRSAANEEFATTIITVEERMRGWLAAIKRRREFVEQVFPYEQLHGLQTFFRDWHVVRFDEAAASRATQLRKAKIRIGTPDLKIAAIALAHGAVLLSANCRDFERVPDLVVENWLE